jgi:phospholipase/carboxylesterase
MISKWIINEPIGKRKGCIVALPGRGTPAETMERFVCHMDLPNTLVICLEPSNLRWYPQPNGPNDQREAVAGMERATDFLNKRLSKIQRAFRLRRQQIALVGYSAGSVMALNMCVNSNQPFAAVASMAGAILEPEHMPVANNQTPILLRHAIDDDCFKWDERYIPMKQSLLRGGYNVYVSEKNYGGHGISTEDAGTFGRFLAPFLGYNQLVDSGSQY